ncbi:kielin/chordin-like protein [Pituophis catenifer annectens]|uniref:kielin/chordin-like protein n=1 Tax=Pituophis catenifer annectens TaxID=94852 RepID=UPI0039921E78
MRGCWQLLALPWAALALQGPWTGAETTAGTDSERRDFGDDVLDLLEALNISRSVPGVSKIKGPDPGIPAWKFRRRVPILTLPWDYSIYLLSTVQAALGFHFVARQSPGSEGTLISLASPAASKRDGHPLLQLASSTQENQLRLAYRAVHNMEPASLVFPGSTPFAHGRWAQLALNLEPRRISLYVDCQEPFVFENGRGEDLLSLLLPLDLQITFASLAGDESSKFLGSWQTAEISPHGFPHRPWHCENLPELDLFSLPYGLSEDQYLDLPEESSLDLGSLPPFGPLALAETHRYQQEPSQPDLPPLGSSRSGVASLEDQIQRLEELVEGLGIMLDMVKEQNSDLLGRVKTLEQCECRRATCFADGRHYEVGASWDQDPCTSCMCVQGKAECQLQPCQGEEMPEVRDSPCQVPFEGIGPREAGGMGWWPFFPFSSCQDQPRNQECVIYRVDFWISTSQDCPQVGRSQKRQDGSLRSARGHHLDVFDLEVLGHDTQEPHCLFSCMPCLAPIALLPLIASRQAEIQQVRFPPVLPAGCADGRKDGESWKPDPCRRCQCEDGRVTCEVEDCPPVLCQHPATPEDRCCPECGGCRYKGHLLKDRDGFLEDPCTHCTCEAGTVRCQVTECPQLLCQDRYTPPGQCCPDCRQACELDGRPVQPGQEATSADGCQRCSCSDGKLLCSQIPCPELDCSNPEKVPGECCPRCQGCANGTARHEHGEEWTPPTEPCLRCKCQEGNAICQRRQCASLCRHPARPRPGTCCPACDGCLWEGREYRSGHTVQTADLCKRCRCVVSLLGRVGRWVGAESVPGGHTATPHSDLLVPTQAGEVSCRQLSCPPAHCSHPGKRPEECCPTCDACEFEGRLYQDRERFLPAAGGPCLQCQCLDGHVRCQEELCPPPPCARPLRDPKRCCPVCTVCVFEDLEFEDGTEWAPARDPCSVCTCHQGETVCHALQCPPVTCQHPARLLGSCCPQCHQCLYNQRLYSHGQEFADPDNSCQNCQCKGGTVHCSPTVCPPVTCPHPERRPGSCCPTCPSCLQDNQLVPDGEEVPNPLDPCQSCICSGGELVCTPRKCVAPLCAHPLPGSCCQNNCNGCSYTGKEYPNGAEFPHPTDSCRQCHCINGHVQCLSRRCPPLLCPEPTVRPQECCPQCPAPPAGCLYLGVSYKHLERFYDPSEKCRTCVCANSTITCQRQPCAPVLCSHPLQQGCCRSCDGCLYQGKELPNGEQFVDPQDPCRLCSCWEGGVVCKTKACPAAECPFPVPGPCCKSCEGCEYVSQRYLSGQEFPDPQDTCGLCSCLGGFVTCTRKPCFQAPCSHPLRMPSQCCPTCHGEVRGMGGQEKIDCAFHGVTVANGQAVPDPGDPLCSECTCQAGSIHCMKKLCTPVSCAHPVPGPCTCPLCQGCRFRGQDYGDGESFASPHQPCEECQCLRGTVKCSPTPCPPVPCQEPVTPPGQCCPKCPGACRYQGHLYKSGEVFTSPQDPCRNCTCQVRTVTCQPKPCPQQCAHPVPPARAACCPLCDGCLYEGQEYANRAVFTPPSDPCRRCSCLGGNVLCAPMVCPPASCAKPSRKLGECCLQCQVCQHAGQEYPEGTQWLSALDPCQECSCGDGNVRCEVIPCPPAKCAQPVTEPGVCCPRCQGCVHEGQDRADGSSWFAPSEPCQACLCADGVVTCTRIICVNSCPAQVEVPGECCPVCADCSYRGRHYGPGESFQPGGDPCEICTCQLMSDGHPHLQCHRKQCPSLLDCTQDQIQAPAPGACCPTCAQALSNCTSDLLGNEVQATQEPCYTCMCQDLTWVCVHRGCPLLSCPSAQRFTPPGSCCPICDECVIEADGRRVSDGETWKDSADSCVSCSCHLGHVECHIQECLPLVCQDGLVEVQVPGQCCAECQDPGQNCSHLSQVFHSNQRWQVDECTSCTCVSGQVHCRRERCPPSTCAADETPALIPGVCCPRCVPHPATCVAFGDPHYRTFDGKMIHFQGGCKYVLSQDCHGEDFSIHVTNEDRGRPGVSWTKEVTVLIGDTTVQLLQDGVVMVDSQTVTLPFLKEPLLSVEPKGSTLLLNTNIGVKVLWNGRSHLEVSVPGTYKGRLCGLCGNFNSFPQDDLRMRSGHLSLSEAAFGNSWKASQGGGRSHRCADALDADPCKGSGYRSRKEANARCKVLKSPPFARCHAAVAPEPFFASCVYDLCACGAAGTDDCLCEVLEAYASQCRHAGVMLQWRSPTLCAVGCPQERGYVFDECGPPCPKTCFNHAVPLGVLESHCFKPCVPGCQCPAGLVEHQAHCILPETCPPIVHGTL